jgi:hypothetical protein
MNKNLIFTIVAIVIVGLGLFWLIDAQTDRAENGGFDTATELPAVGRLEEITSDPQQYFGQQVTVQGEVGDVLGVNAVVLTPSGGITSDGLLVISQAPISNSVDEVEGLFEQQQARLTGTVAQFAYANYRDSLDLNIQPEQMSAYEGRPFILTDVITTVAE